MKVVYTIITTIISERLFIQTAVDNFYEHFYFNSPKEPPSSVPKCDVKPCIHVWGDATGMPGIMESVQLNMNGIPALQPCMHDAEIACLAEYTWSSKGIPLIAFLDLFCDISVVLHSALVSACCPTKQSAFMAALPMDKHCMTQAAWLFGLCANQKGCTNGWFDKYGLSTYAETSPKKCIQKATQEQCSCKVANREKSLKQLVILFGFVGKLWFERRQ